VLFITQGLQTQDMMYRLRTWNATLR